MDAFTTINNSNNELTTSAGDSEVQLLEFFTGQETFGINIAKVSEIIRYTELTPLPSAPPQIEGVFMHRDKLVTVIDLHKVLNLPLEASEGNGMFIVCDFDQLSVAFHVSSVNGIQSLSWGSIEKPPAVSGAESDSVATGIAKLENKMIMILDFEKIICDYNHGHEFEIGDVSSVEIPDTFDYNRTIVVAEDSPFLNKIVIDALKKAGFQNYRSFFNGLDAWDYIRSLKGSNDIKKTCAAIITDIEMPQMDGHSLIKCVKSDKELRTIPIFIFSSLIHDNMRQRGDSAGADGQFSRSQLPELFTEMISFLR